VSVKSVEKLLNDDKISVPTSEDGRYGNVASFNVKPLLIGEPKARQQQQAALKAEMAAASDPVAKKRLSDRLVILEAINKA
jgi:2',3'-cyclic-nucleotide 2'-phosphodiesterase / 3'-nucleotidase